MKLKVMTFNIHHGTGTDGINDIRRILQVIEESGADLIALNEVDQHFSRRSAYINQIAYLGRHLAMDYAFGTTLALSTRRRYGNAFLSRYPILYVENHRYKHARTSVERRALLELKVQTPWQPLKVFVTHLSVNPLNQKKQIRFVLEKVVDETLPVIFLGDLNVQPYAWVWKEIDRHLQDVSANNHRLSLTFPAHRPKRQLDYIWVSDHFIVESAYVNQLIPQTSDHLPLLALLNMKERDE